MIKLKKIQKCKIRLVWKLLAFFFLCKVILPLQGSTGEVTHFFLHPTLCLFSCIKKANSQLFKCYCLWKIIFCPHLKLQFWVTERKSWHARLLVYQIVSTRKAKICPWRNNKLTLQCCHSARLPVGHCLAIPKQVPILHKGRTSALTMAQRTQFLCSAPTLWEIC